MAWCYPDIPLEDLMKLVKAFVDMLLLASGYQSTGRPAHWQSDDIKRAFQWALFLQNVSKKLTSSDDYRDCVEELDTALSELTSNPSFPQSLVPFSSITLGRAKDLLLERLVHTFPSKESHLKAIVMASVEMDFDSLRTIYTDCLDAYLEKLVRIVPTSLNLSRNEEQNVAFLGAIPSRKREESVECDFSLPLIGELGRRQVSVSFLSAVESGLEIILAQNMHQKLGKTLNPQRLKPSSSVIAEELPVESLLWSHWRSKILSYMLDKRTMRLVSGANMVFSAPQGQWHQMFERLTSSAGNDDLCEITELLLLGCIAHRWNALIKQLMSVPYESVTIARLCNEVFNLPLQKPQSLLSSEDLMDVKEKNIIGYVEFSLRSHLNELWKLSPVLAAVAIPLWSELFRSYLLELQHQFRGYSSATRCCSCITDGLAHREYKVSHLQPEKFWLILAEVLSRSGDRNPFTYPITRIKPEKLKISLGMPALGRANYACNQGAKRLYIPQQLLLHNAMIKKMCRTVEGILRIWNSRHAILMWIVS